MTLAELEEVEFHPRKLRLYDLVVVGELIGKVQAIFHPEAGPDKGPSPWQIECLFLSGAFAGASILRRATPEESAAFVLMGPVSRRVLVYVRWNESISCWYVEART